MSSTTPAANAADAVPAVGTSVLPGGDAKAEANGLLAQTSLLTNNLDDAHKELEQLRKAKQELDEIKKAALDEYKKVQEPKFEEWVKGKEESEGAPMDQRRKAAFYQVFTNPAYKAEAEGNYKEHQRIMADRQQVVALAASKAEKEKEFEDLKAKHAQLVEMMSKAETRIGGMRSTFAAATNSTAVELQASKDDSMRRPTAGGLSSRDMFVPVPSPAAWELGTGFLKEYGYGNDVSVSASANDDRPLKPLPQTVPRAPEHPLLYMQDNEKALPNSMRYYNPALYGLIIDKLIHAPQDTLSALTRINPDPRYTFVDDSRRVQ